MIAIAADDETSMLTLGGHLADLLQGSGAVFIRGDLGAGKTTLLCRLLEQTSLRITAIVNDVAAINVDAALIRSRNAETIEFQNGCACCSLQTDLRDTLQEIGSRGRRPQAVLIEASGIADPMGAALYHYYAHGALKAEGDSITEGIGQGRITANLEDVPIDEPFQIPDDEALPIIFDLVLKEGHVLGGSSGINIAGAIRLAERLGPGHTIVTILADYGTRYVSKLFNPEFLRAKDLPVPQWLESGGDRGND